MIVQYLQRLQRILGDTVVERFNPFDLLAYINEARGIVAAEGECVRELCPSTAGLSSIAVTAGGTGYTSAPTITFTPPTIGSLPTAQAFVFGGAVVAINLLFPGSGYTVPPSITFTGGGGTGAAASASLMPFAQVVAGQETYFFKDFNPLIVGTGRGAQSILGIFSISISWGSMKPTLDYLSWGDFQAYLRSYNVGPQGYPRVWSQYQPGTTGRFQIWPVPSQNAQMDLDCVCLPADLLMTSDIGAEAIPYPYTNCVPYKAAELAVLGEPDLRDLAPRYKAHYELRRDMAAQTSTPTRVPSYYNFAGTGV